MPINILFLPRRLRHAPLLKNRCLELFPRYYQHILSPSYRFVSYRGASNRKDIFRLSD